MILQVDQYILLMGCFPGPRNAIVGKPGYLQNIFSDALGVFNHLPIYWHLPCLTKTISPKNCPEKNTTWKNRGVSPLPLELRPGAAGPSKPKKPKVWGENRRRMMTYLSLLAGGSTFNQLFGDLWETHRIHGTFVYVPTFIHEIQSNVGK